MAQIQCPNCGAYRTIRLVLSLIGVTIIAPLVLALFIWLSDWRSVITMAIAIALIDVPIWLIVLVALRVGKVKRLLLCGICGYLWNPVDAETRDRARAKRDLIMKGY